MRKFQNTSSFVSPVAPEMIADPIVERALTKGVERDVLVPLFANLFGGVGMFVLAFVLYEWITSWDMDSLLWIAARWSAGLFALMCIIRFWGDEVQMWAYRISKGWAEGSVNQKLKWYQEENKQLQEENRHLSVQMAQMSKYVRVDAVQERQQPVQDEYTKTLTDALKLCRFHDAQGKAARDPVVAAGLMSKTQWEAARDLLVDSGVPVNGGVFGVAVAEAMAKVREFVERQRQSPAGFVQPYE